MKNSYQPKIIHFLYSNQNKDYVELGKQPVQQENLPFLTYIMNEYKRSWSKMPYPHYLSDYNRMEAFSDNGLSLAFTFYIRRNPLYFQYQKVIIELEERKIKHWKRWFRKHKNGQHY